MSDNFDRIEDFLYGTMSAEARAAFEQELAANAQLRQEVNLHKVEHLAMQQLLQQDLKSTLQSWKDAPAAAAPTQEKPAPALRPIWGSKMFQMAIAASFALLFGVWWFVRDTPDRLFGRTEMVERGHNDLKNLPPALTAAYDAMNRRDYRTALSSLAQVTDENYSNDVGKLKGECYFWLKEYDAAAVQFEQLARTPLTPKEGYWAEWHLLLTYWAKNDLQKAKALKEQILQTPGHTYQSDAKKLKI